MAAEGSIDPETPDGGDRPARSESPHSSSAHNQPILPIPAKLQGQIDHSAWGKLLDFDNNPEPSEGQTTAHIGFLVECWRESNTTGPSLWQEFKDEFEEWTDEQWANLPRRIGTWLRSFLVANGVMMEEDSRIYGQLRQTARREEYKEWSDDDITRISKTNKEFRLNLSDREFVQDIQGTLPPWKETVSATTPTIRPPPPSTVSKRPYFQRHSIPQQLRPPSYKSQELRTTASLSHRPRDTGRARRCRRRYCYPMYRRRYCYPRSRLPAPWQARSRSQTLPSSTPVTT
jgi:hypothetical protein